MVNLIITTGCNKNCPYCFASEVRHRNDSNTMTLETFRSVLDKIQASGKNFVKILGGEPTQHPQFKEFIEEITSRKMCLTLISNFLFSEDISQYLIEAMNKITIDFLINSTNLDEKNRIKTWARNYNAIYRHLYKFDLEEKMACGITFEKNKSLEYYINYVDFLLQHIPKIERLRLSLNFPGSKNDKDKFDFINNTSYGDKFIALIDKCYQVGTKPNIDCIIYPCMFEHKEHFKFVSKFTGNVHTECSKPPTDVFPNQEAIYCYPLENSIKINTVGMGFDDVKDKLRELYNNIREKVELPEACLICRHYKKNCYGPCLGFFDLEDI